MAKKHVHSQDPRKPAIVAALKQKSGGTKVTLLAEVEPGVFEGSCMRTATKRVETFYGAVKRFEELGMFRVTAAEAGLT
jgi:hypothetical protein